MDTATPRYATTLPVVERLRIEASRRFASDPELDAIEHELRMDLHGNLSWDSSRERVQQLLESLQQPPCKSSVPSLLSERNAAESTVPEVQADGHATVQRVGSAESRSWPAEGWRVTSQEDWQLRGERCTMTILSRDVDGMVRLELLRHSDRTTLHVTSTRQRFASVIQEQNAELHGRPRESAAAHQLFQEALKSGRDSDFNNLVDGAFARY
mmetsp:Transcript_3887/g.7806  ORF Transcript_3887/g.7806 Transcript_3887/m.7806 type:complete len:212 (-) Transcript_3887:8-643(-)